LSTEENSLQKEQNLQQILIYKDGYR